MGLRLFADRAAGFGRRHTENRPESGLTGSLAACSATSTPELNTQQGHTHKGGIHSSSPRGSRHAGCQAL
jgi:hypothetical protein